MTRTGDARAIALVPLRGDGKSRLDATVDAADRGALVVAMLDDVLAALSGGGVDDVLVLAGDDRAAALASERGLPTLTDPTIADGPAPVGDARLRAAVDAALVSVPAERVRLVVAADLPRLSAAEVAAVLAEPAEVVVVPTAGGGTALLRLDPGVVLAAQYGDGSAGAHLHAADVAGRSSAVLDLPGARHDVDAAADLHALRGPLDGAHPGPATTAFVAGVAG